MDRNNRNALIAAAIILLGFGALAYVLPTLMIAAGEASPALALLLAGVFLFSFFLIFWLRGRSRGGDRDRD